MPLRTRQNRVRYKLFHATGTSQTLPYAIEGAHRVLRCSRHFSVATGVKAFETTAIEDDGGTKAAHNDVLSDRILRKLKNRSGVATRTTCGSLSFRKTVHKITGNINASALKAKSCTVSFSTLQALPKLYHI